MLIQSQSKFCPAFNANRISLSKIKYLTEVREAELKEMRNIKYKFNQTTSSFHFCAGISIIKRKS